MNQKIVNPADVKLQRSEQKVNPQEEEQQTRRLAERYRC